MRPLFFLLGFLLVLPGMAAAEEIALDQARREALSELPVLIGGPLTSELLDEKIVLVAFFASWCPPCHKEFDDLNAMQAAYGDKGVEILAVNIFEDFGRSDGGARLTAFLDRKAPAFHVLGEGEAVGPLFGDVQRIPTLFVFDRKGRAALHFIHARGATKMSVTYEEMAAAVEPLL